MLKRAVLIALLLSPSLFSVVMAAPPAQAIKLDPKMYGMWLLDAAHSKFGGPYPSPTSGLVNWTEHGWVFAVNSAEGLYGDATVIDHGCILVGVKRDYTCEVRIVTPTHLHLIMRNNGRIEREGDIELLDANTQRAVHRVTPSAGASYTEATIWTRAH